MDFKRPHEVESLMNIDEVCAVLGCKKSKLYQLMASGLLESVKVVGSRRFRPDAVREFVERHVAPCKRAVCHPIMLVLSQETSKGQQRIVISI